MADHQELFDRVSLDLEDMNTETPTDQLVQVYREGNYSKYLEILSFQFGRYLTIAGSRGTLPSNLVGLWTVGDSAWTIQNLWAHYEFTQDEAYLEEVIYPIMKEAALFGDQYLWTSSYQVIDDEYSPYDGQARVVVAPSFSEEQGPTAIGTTYDQSLVWELYNRSEMGKWCS